MSKRRGPGNPIVTLSSSRNKLSKFVTKSQLKTILNSKTEVKISDVLYNNTLGSAAYIYDLMQVSQGTANVNNRIGLAINPLKINIRIILSVAYALTGQNYNNIRLIIFRDLQQKDSNIPVVSDVLSIANPVAQLNYFNYKRFQILDDRRLTLNYYRPSTTLDLAFKLKGETRYSGPSSSSINKNGLYFLLIDDNTSNPTTFNFWSRLHFTDN